jgi:hypothetical protein
MIATDEVSEERLREIIHGPNYRASLLEAELMAAEIQRRRASASAEAADAGRWVPVTERLPVHSGYYEVTSSDPWPPRVYVLELRDAEWPDHAHWRVDGAFTGYVTAWRPLPAPYTPPTADPTAGSESDE